MSTGEKKKFLSMDLIDRIIRIEQRVSSSFHRYITYQQTEYYKSLSPEIKKKYDNYLRWKKTRHASIFAALGCSFILLFVLTGLRLTGNAIMESSGIGSGWTLIIAAAVIITCLAFLIRKSSRAGKFERHFEFTENLLLKRKYKSNAHNK